MAELAVEFLPLGVVDGEEPFFNFEGVLVVHAEVGAGELGGPAFKILAVEELNPFFFGFGSGSWFGFGFLAVGEGKQKGEEGEFFEHGRMLSGTMA